MAAARFEDIIAALEQSQVRYVVAGGFAVNLHGFLRFTKDLDLLIDPDPGNARQAMAVLASAGMRPRVPVAIEDFADPVRREDWFRSPNMLVFQLRDPDDAFRTADVFIRNPIDFDQLWARSEYLDLGRTSCRIAGIHDLIAMQGTGRAPAGYARRRGTAPYTAPERCSGGLMNDPLAVSFEQAAENHLRDALAMSHARRWQWLAQAMDLGISVARSRASRGLPSVDSHGNRMDVSGVNEADPGSGGNACERSR